MSAQASERKPNCNACAHFYITHDPAFPYGCRQFGFKSRHQPAQDVLASSGLPCMRFEPKARPPARRPAGR